MKSKIINVIALLAYWLAIDALFYWLNRKAKRILTFHNVLPDSMFRDGVANGVSNRLSEFIRIIDECSKKSRFSTDLFDAKTLTITFDDGYRNQYSVAFKELEKRGIPAYVFVSGDVIKNKGRPGLVVDLLTHWMDNVPAGQHVLQFDRGGQICQINDSNRLAMWSQIIWPAFMDDVTGKGRNVLAACDKAYSMEKILSGLTKEYVRDRLNGISGEEREEMRKAGWKIGWHTWSHFPLAKLGDSDLIRELDSPEEFRNECLSYPYGNMCEVGAPAIKLAESKDFPCAVSNTNETQEGVSPYFLPRMSLLSDKYRLHFQLSGLEYFLKHRRLLPCT